VWNDIIKHFACGIPVYGIPVYVGFLCMWDSCVCWANTFTQFAIDILYKVNDIQMCSFLKIFNLILFCALFYV